MKQIKLTKGYFASVDDEDFEWLNQWKWYAQLGHGGPYAARRITKTKLIWMHRIILNAPPHLCVDHINGDTLSNLRSNLRLCTAQQNQWNQHKSGLKGIYFAKRDRKWRANICFNNKIIALGSFDSKENAAKAYNKKAEELFSELANLNRTLE